MGVGEHRATCSNRAAAVNEYAPVRQAYRFQAAPLYLTILMNIDIIQSLCIIAITPHSVSKRVDVGAIIRVVGRVVPVFVGDLDPPDIRSNLSQLYDTVSPPGRGGGRLPFH